MAVRAEIVLVARRSRAAGRGQSRPAAARRRAPAHPGADPLGRRRRTALHRRGRPLGPGLRPAGAGGRRHDRALGAAQSHGQPRPAGLGAHRRPRGHDLPRLRHPAARRAALSHRRPHQSRSRCCCWRRSPSAPPSCRSRSNIALSMLTIVSIAVLGVFHQPLPWRGPPLELPEIYQAGAWAGLTLTTLLITLYGWRLAEEARQMADALAAAQAALAPRAAPVGAGRAGRRRGARARLAAVDHRRRRQGDAARDRARRSAARGRRVAVGRVRPLPLDPGAALGRSGGRRVGRLRAGAAAGADRSGGAELRSRALDITFEAGPIGEGVPASAPIQLRSPEIMQGIGNIVQNAVSFARHEVRIATRWTTRMVGGRGDRTTGRASPRRCSTNSARPSFRPGRARKATWAWASSSPRRCWNAPAPR